MFLHNNVRHLMLHYALVDAEAILNLCTGVENLCLLSLTDRILPVIEPLPLTRLYAPSYKMSPATLLTFSRLTHLHLGGDPQHTVSTWAAVVALPALTHLATDGRRLVLLAHKMLDSLPSLCVLVLFQSSDRMWSDQVDMEELDPQLTSDMRFVAMFKKR